MSLSLSVKKRPELEKCTLTLHAHTGLHTHTTRSLWPLVPQNLITNKIQREFEPECEEKARIREVHTHTHSHSGLCARDRVTYSAPKHLARGLLKHPHTPASCVGVLPCSLRQTSLPRLQSKTPSRAGGRLCPRSESNRYILADGRF